MRRLASLVVVLLAGAITVACGGSTDGPSEGADTIGFEPLDRAAGEDRSLAQVLADLQRGRQVSPEAPLVRKIHRQLAALERKCRESRERIAELAVAARRRLANEGANLGIHRILRTVNRSIAKDKGARCRPVFRELGRP